MVEDDERWLRRMRDDGIEQGGGGGVRVHGFRFLFLILCTGKKNDGWETAPTQEDDGGPNAHFFFFLSFFSPGR